MAADNCPNYFSWLPGGISEEAWFIVARHLFLRVFHKLGLVEFYLGWFFVFFWLIVPILAIDLPERSLKHYTTFIKSKLFCRATEKAGIKRVCSPDAPGSPPSLRRPVRNQPQLRSAKEAATFCSSVEVRMKGFHQHKVAVLVPNRRLECFGSTGKVLDIEY